MVNYQKKRILLDDFSSFYSLCKETLFTNDSSREKQNFMKRNSVSEISKQEIKFKSSEIRKINEGNRWSIARGNESCLTISTSLISSGKTDLKERSENSKALEGRSDNWESQAKEKSESADLKSLEWEECKAESDVIWI